MNLKIVKDGSYHRITGDTYKYRGHLLEAGLIYDSFSRTWQTRDIKAAKAAIRRCANLATSPFRVEVPQQYIELAKHLGGTQLKTNEDKSQTWALPNQASVNMFNEKIKNESTQGGN